MDSYRLLLDLSGYWHRDWDLQEIRGSHCFLSEDGIQMFDGVKTWKPSEIEVNGTVVDRLRDVWPRIVAGKRGAASAAHWKKETLYLLSVPVDGSDVNNLVIAWDYSDNSFWLWDNIPAQIWSKFEGQNDQERLLFTDIRGHIFELGVADHDHGTAIDSHVTIRRIGYKEAGSRFFREVELTARNQVNALTVQVGRNGQPLNKAPTGGALDFTSRNEAVYGTGVFGTAVFAYFMERVRSMYFRITGNHFQVKVSTANKGNPFWLSLVRCGFMRTRR